MRENIIDYQLGMEAMQVEESDENLENLADLEKDIDYRREVSRRKSRTPEKKKQTQT